MGHFCVEINSPPFFRLSINGHLLVDRVFGGALLWSSTGDKLFVQEWRSTQNADTTLLCIDTSTFEEKVIAEAPGGFLYPKTYQEGSIFYVETYYAGRHSGSTEKHALVEAEN